MRGSAKEFTRVGESSRGGPGLPVVYIFQLAKPDLTFDLDRVIDSFEHSDGKGTLSLGTELL